MAVDPTGAKAAVAAIPKGQLSERQHRIATGCALVREQGLTISEAARRVSIPITTLWNYVRGVSSLEKEMPAQRDTEAVLRASYDISQIAADAILESLATERDQWKHADLIKAYGVATDKVVALSRDEADQANGAASVIAKTMIELMQSHDVSITRRDPADDALEVDATKTTDPE